MAPESLASWVQLHWFVTLNNLLGSCSDPPYRDLFYHEHYLCHPIRAICPAHCNWIINQMKKVLLSDKLAPVKRLMSSPACELSNHPIYRRSRKRSGSSLDLAAGLSSAMVTVTTRYAGSPRFSSRQAKFVNVTKLDVTLPTQIVIIRHMTSHNRHEACRTAANNNASWKLSRSSSNETSFNDLTWSSNNKTSFNEVTDLIIRQCNKFYDVTDLIIRQRINF